jgi:aspartate aminotransferase
MVDSGQPRVISSRALTLPPSSIRRIVLRAAELEAGGRELCRLDMGSLDLPLPRRIAEGIAEAVAAGRTGYSAAEGIAAYRQAAAAHIARRFAASADTAGLDGAALTPLVIGSQGGTQAINALFYLLADQGGAVLLPEIAWPNYMQQAHLAGVEARFYALDERYHPVPQSIAALSEGASAFVLNSPSNPTGAVIPPPLMRELHALARSRGLHLLSDESYCDLVFDGEHLSPLELDWTLPPEERRVFAVFSCSKSYAAPGLRLGYTVCPNAGAARTLGLLGDPLMGCLTTPLEWAMVAGFELEDGAERRTALLPRWRRAGETLAGHGLAFAQPGGGMFFFVDISASGLSSDEFALRLLEEKGVAVIPGGGFGLHPRPGGGYSILPRADRHVRLCFTAPEEVFNEGCARLARLLRELVQENGDQTRADEQV